ncbi:unnamed protein product [Mucor hiemalis]
MISHLKEIISVGDNSNNKKDYLPVGYVKVDRLKSREGEALRGLGSQVSKMGVGVTKEAQDIFNALSKTLPCRWSKDTIVVMDEILITPPYSVNDCKANSTSAASLARVKKVVRHAFNQMSLLLIKIYIYSLKVKEKDYCNRNNSQIKFHMKRLLLLQIKNDHARWNIQIITFKTNLFFFLFFFSLFSSLFYITLSILLYLYSTHVVITTTTTTTTTITTTITLFS